MVRLGISVMWLCGCVEWYAVSGPPPPACQAARPVCVTTTATTKGGDRVCDPARHSTCCRTFLKRLAVMGCSVPMGSPSVMNPVLMGTPAFGGKLVLLTNLCSGGMCGAHTVPRNISRAGAARGQHPGAGSAVMQGSRPACRRHHTTPELMNRPATGGPQCGLSCPAVSQGA